MGNSNYSKIAGTADKLDFTVTQVGNTSLADTLQNAVALCGYISIGIPKHTPGYFTRGSSDAELFIKKIIRIKLEGSWDDHTKQKV